MGTKPFIQIIRDFLTPGTPPPNEFVGWEKPEPEQLAHVSTFGELNEKSRRLGSPGENLKEVFYENIQNQLNTSGISAINIDFGQSNAKSEVSTDKASIERPIDKFIITYHGTFLLRNLYINNLKITPSNGRIKVSIENCFIKNLTYAGHRNQPVNLALVDSHVANLNVSNPGLELLMITGGSVLNIICPTPSEDNPFTGDVNFNDVFFPRSANWYPITGAQGRRNLRYHLKANSNEQSANIIHASELAIERKDDPLFTKFISYMYEVFSDFGRSALRPLVWFISLSVISTFLIAFNYGTVPANSLESYSGWQREALLDVGFKGELIRAATLTGQQILNPLGILGTKGLTVASNGWILAWNMFYSLMSVILIALFIFAIRRRFKLQ